MKITAMDRENLLGNQFSNAYAMSIENNLLYSRIERILMMTKEKTILHVGCCDHIPLIKGKIENGTWLQGLLDKNCKQVVGVDINQEAVNYVNENGLSSQAVYCADITSEDLFDVIPKIQYDYVLLGEVVEHLDNPVSFLSAIRKSLLQHDIHSKCIITVPNAFSLLKYKLKNNHMTELINSDHRYWFTPYTICKVLTMSGLTPTELFFASCGAGGNGRNRMSEKFFRRLERIRKRPSSWHSFVGDQIIVEAELNF